ncbi:hypothetical protein PROVRUST_07826 [Providencia rustigianii DSM 4541]|uniref:Uncharacterized protein n=1 Tax=Providencia rustigianii DSM 4541 TaxID=500637 RepID=D1P6M4_9GAMM|nr:hypothetical protein PROVRUST_07826 [Providencia rustigianii DSM 4541]
MLRKVKNQLNISFFDRKIHFFAIKIPSLEFQMLSFFKYVISISFDFS